MYTAERYLHFCVAVLKWSVYHNFKYHICLNLETDTNTCPDPVSWVNEVACSGWWNQHFQLMLQ